MRTGRPQFVALGLATSLVYIASAKMGLSLAFVAEQVTVVWPPTGIALSALLIFGFRIWPFIAAGAFIANITNNTPALTSLGIAAGNTLEAIAGAYLLTRLVGFRPSLDRFRDVFGLIFLAAGISTIISATIGVLTLCVTGVQQWSQFGSLWFVWYLGDAMGDLVVAPVVLTLSAAPSRDHARSRSSLELVVVFSSLVVASLFVFAGSRYHPPDYAVFPFFIWAALRFGSGGTAFSIFITSTIAVLGTVQGSGPFASGGTNENLIALQLFMSVAAATGLIIAVSQMERERAVTSLHGSEQRYRSLVLASTQVVWTTNAAGDIVEDLPTWRAFTGQTKKRRSAAAGCARYIPTILRESPKCGTSR